jgi:prephenate dehydrogenase/chorismate mutase
VSDLDSCRAQIDGIDEQLVSLLGARMRICEAVAGHKAREGIPVMQRARVEGVLRRCSERAVVHGLQPQFVRSVYEVVIAATCAREHEIVREIAGSGRPPHRGPVARAMVVGARGGVGASMAELLRGAGVEVVGVDLRPGGDGAEGDIVGDATCPGGAVEAAAARCDWVVVCVPDAGAVAVMEVLHRSLPRGALIADTTSVKTPVATWAGGARGDVEILSLNPLFSPDLGFAGRRVAAVPLRSGPHTRQLLAIVEAAGATVVRLGADEHDREVALTQAVVHAAILAVGRALAALTGEGGWRLATPPFQALVLLVARISAAEPELYRRIQHANPHAAPARAALADGVREVDDATRSAEDFAELVRIVRGRLGPALGDLRSRSRALLERVEVGAGGEEP